MTKQKHKFFVSFQTGEASAFDVSPSFNTKAQAIAFGNASNRSFAIHHMNVCVFEK